MWLAFKRLAPIAVFGVLPVAVFVFAVLAFRHGSSIAVDFRGELYPEAKLVLHGKNPFPSAHADLSGGVNRIFPIPAAFLAIPLTFLPVGAAAIVVSFILLAALAATLWILEVRDWRLYGMVVLWPGSIAGVQTGNLTILLGLLVAVAWRLRERRFAPGLAIGLAIALKLFLWPLVVWLLAIRRFGAAGAAIAVSLVGFLLILPFESLGEFARLMSHLGNTFGGEGYTPTGLLVQAGISGLGTAKVVSDVLGLLLLGAAYGRRSLPLSVAAALVLSPIVWLHYFELLVIPLALRRPRLEVAWAVPLLLWVCPGTAGEIRLRHIVVALIVLAIVTVLAERNPTVLERPGAIKRATGGDAALSHVLP